jgi:hypothetical protein
LKNALCKSRTSSGWSSTTRTYGCELAINNWCYETLAQGRQMTSNFPKKVINRTDRSVSDASSGKRAGGGEHHQIRWTNQANAFGIVSGGPTRRE